MTNQEGAIAFDAVINDQNFQSHIDQMKRDIRGLSSTTQTETSKMNDSFSTLAKYAAGFFSINVAQQFVRQLVNVRGEFQQIGIALGTILQSKAKGDALMSQLVQTAMITPFRLLDISQGAKQLIAYGIAAEDVNDTLKRLGNIASGLSLPLERLTYLYGTTFTQGRLYGRDLMQFTTSGIPLLQGLAKEFGVTTDEVYKLVEEGKIGFPEVKKVIEDLTNSGGKFYNLMEQQSKTLTGRISNLQDAFDLMLNKIGQSSEGVLNSGIDAAQYLVANYETVGKSIAALIAVYGTYKAAVIAVNVIENVHKDILNGSVSYLNAETVAKIDNAASSASVQAAIAKELQARLAASEATLQQARVEVSLAADKTESAIAAAKQSAVEIAAAKERVAAAEAVIAAQNQYTSSLARESAQKQLSIAQNDLLAASEKGIAARKEASAAASSFSAAQTDVETAARTTNTLATKAQEASTLANIAAEKAEAVATARLTAWQELRAAVTKKLTAIQEAFNASMLSNPYVLATVAIVGLVAAMWALHDGTTAEQRAMNEVNDEMEKFKQHVDDIKSKTSELLGIIRSETSTRFQQIQAYKQLQAIYPELLKNKSLESFLTENNTAQQKALNGEIDKMSLQHAIDEYNKFQPAIKEAEKWVNHFTDAVNKKGSTGGLINSDDQQQLEKWQEILKNVSNQAAKYKKQIDDAKQAEWESKTPVEQKIKVYQATIESLKQQRLEMERNLQQAKKVNGAFVSWQDTINSLTFDKLGEKIGSFQAQLDEWMKDPANKKGTLENLKNDLQEAQNNQGSAKTRSEFDAYQKNIDAIQRKIDAITGGAKKAESAVEKIFPAGSVAEYNRQINKLQDSLSKINPDTHPEQVVRLQGQIQDLTQKRIEAEKKIEIQSFQDQIDEKKKQYQDYESWVLKFGKEIANAQFQDLLKNGTSYVDFLQKKLDKINAQPKTKQQRDNSILLTNELDTAKGNKSAIDKFSDDLEKLKSKSSSVTDYINSLKAQEDALIGQTSELAIQKINLLKQKIAEANGDLVDMVRQFLQQVGNYETQSAAISAHYAALRQAINQSDLKDKKTALDEANQAEKEANENLINAQIDKKNKLEGLYKEIVGTGRDALKKQLDNDQKALDNAIKIAGGDMSNDRVIHFLNLVEQDKKSLSDFDVSKWQDWASIVTQAGGELSQLPGVLGEIGQVMNVLTQGAQQLYDTIKKSNEGQIKTGDAIAAGASAVASWVNIIASSITQRKQAEEDYYNSVISYQNSYNLALIEQIKLQSQAQSNIFSEDYLAEIKDNWAAATTALDDYSKAIKALDDAQVKTGTKKVVNWAAVGSGALSGVAAGATIGSIVPVIGNALGAAVGGVVGGLIGLFGGKKTVDTFGKLLDEYPHLLNAQGELNKAQAQSLLDSGLLDAKSQELLQHATDLQKAYEDAKKAIDDIIQGLVGDLGSQLRDALVSAFEDGTDAAQGFADAVENVLSNALSNIIFSAVFDQAFKDLTAKLEESATTGDNNWIDDFGEFFSQYPDLVKQFNEGMKSAQDQAKQFGLDLFGDSSNSNPNSLEGAIKGVSENTASVIAGQMNAIRINQAESLTIVRTQLLRLTTIADNSRYLMYLMSIDKRLAKAAGDPWRAQGVA